MKLVIDIHDVATAQEAAAQLNRATEDADISFDIIGTVQEREEESYDLFGNRSSWPVDVIVPLEEA